MSWRDAARPIIARVISENRDQPANVVRRALRAAYPWGVRKMHPYKIWRDECRRQLGLKPDKAKKGQRAPQPESCAGQQLLFGEKRC